MAKLSVIIITKNEASNIRDCLQSVAWADEIIVVDSNSTDDTVSICKELGAQVYVHDWPGFGIQKSRALGYAKNDWVLSLDADERVTPELQAEIEKTLCATNITFNAYNISRLSNFCGRFMRHSGWYPDLLPRLFKRGKASFSDDLVHERLIIDGEVGQLQGILLHYSFEDMAEVLQKVNQYSSAGAVMMFKRGKRTTLAGAVMRGIWSFIRTYFLRAGFLDGQKGFMLAVSNAEGTYYRYIKLLFMQENNGSK